MEIIGQYLKNMTRFGNVVSSNSSLMPFKIVSTKLMGIATADCEKTDLMSVRSFALAATFVYNLVYTYKCHNYLESMIFTVFITPKTPSPKISIMLLQNLFKLCPRPMILKREARNK